MYKNISLLVYIKMSKKSRASAKIKRFGRKKHFCMRYIRKNDGAYVMQEETIYIAYKEITC